MIRSIDSKWLENTTRIAKWFTVYIYKQYLQFVRVKAWHDNSSCGIFRADLEETNKHV